MATRKTAKAAAAAPARKAPARKASADNNESREKKVKKSSQHNDQFFEEMAEKISQHKDYGKKNPVDIGIACGYTENDVLELMRAIQKMQSKNSVQGKNTKDEKYYFMLRKERERFIVSVDIKSMETNVEESLGEVDFEAFDIGHGIFAYVKPRSKKTIYWKNLITGESDKFLLDGDIRKILVMENGILAIGNRHTMMCCFNGEIEETAIEGGYWEDVIESESKIFLVDRDEIRVLDKSLEDEPEQVYDVYDSASDNEDGLVTDSSQIQAVGVYDDELFGYCSYERYGSGLFNTNKYREKSDEFSTAGEESFIKGDYDCRDENGDIISRSMVTKNYILIDKNIYSKKELEEETHRTLASVLASSYSGIVCEFPRILESKQIVGIYDKDIFLGVVHLGDYDEEYGDCDDEYRDETAVIKVDLQSEREPVILPVKYPEKTKAKRNSSSSRKTVKASATVVEKLGL